MAEANSSTVADPCRPGAFVAHRAMGRGVRESLPWRQSARPDRSAGARPVLAGVLDHTAGTKRRDRQVLSLDAAREHDPDLAVLDAYRSAEPGVSRSSV